MVHAEPKKKIKQKKGTHQTKPQKRHMKQGQDTIQTTQKVHIKNKKGGYRVA